jgi:predicted Rossmann fold nucleotide-binding protein DprA/Smf involved in DNA uptake
MHIDRLRGMVGLPIEEVSSALAMMEIRGQVRSVGGMQYILVHGTAAVGPARRELGGRD